MTTVWVYILECSDDRFYVGSYRGDVLQTRVDEHNMGERPDAWTRHRRPVKLAWCDWFDRYDDAVALERQLKGWSRAKKMAWIAGDPDSLRRLAKRRGRAST